MTPERLAQLQDTAQRLSRDGYSAEYRQIEAAVVHIKEAHATILELRKEYAEAMNEVVKRRVDLARITSIVHDTGYAAEDRVRHVQELLDGSARAPELLRSAQPPAQATDDQIDALLDSMSLGISFRKGPTGDRAAVRRWLATIGAPQSGVARWRCVSYCRCAPSDEQGHFVRDDERGTWVKHSDLVSTPTKSDAL